MGLSDEKVPDSRSQTLKILDWPGKVTGLLGTFTDSPAKVIDCIYGMFSCTVCLSSHTVWTTIFGTNWMHDTDRPVVLADKVGSVTDRSLT